ncbi:MAG: HEPN domain-containing protein [Bacteroidales bacterium]|nr:HEPN domain-containing protein [Bacteroidales bacterium]MBR6068582.1 HEPN domain-containing protein [Bacteroidales bacterium]
MSMTDEERNAITKYRTEKAIQTLEDAKQIAEIKRWSSAVNRLYYSIYYAATALLISNGHISRTHSGMMSLLNQYYVTTGILTKEDSKLIKRLFDLRQESDYDDFIDVDEEDVMHYLPEVETLVQKIISLCM